MSEFANDKKIENENENINEATLSDVDEAVDATPEDLEPNEQSLAEPEMATEPEIEVEPETSSEPEIEVEPEAATEPDIAESTPEFDAFYASFNGDKSNNEKIIDAFLNGNDSALAKSIPAAIRAEVEKKYSEFNYCVSALEVSSVNELANPLSVLGKKEAEVRKIYLFNSAPEAVFTAAFERVITTISLNDEAFLKLCNGVSAFLKREKGVSAAPFAAFEAAIEKLYRTQSGELGRLGICLSLRSVAFTRITNYFDANAPEGVISDDGVLALKAQFERACKIHYDEAAAHKYDLKAAHLAAIEAAVELHNEKCKQLEESTRMGASEFLKLDAVSKSLAGKNSPELDMQMAEMLELYSDYPNVINFYAAKYAVKKRSTIGNGNDPVFITLAKDLGRIRTVASLVFDEAPEVALYLAAAYAPLNEAAVTMISMVKNNSAVFNNLDPRVADAACRGSIKKLHTRMAKEELSDDTEQNIYAALEGFPNRKANDLVNFKLAGNVKIFYSVMCDAWRAYRNGKGFNPKKKSKKGLIWAIVILILVAIAAVGAVFLVKNGYISFDGDNSDSSSTVSQNDDADLSGADISDVVDDSDTSQNSDTSDVSDTSDISDTSDTSDNSDNSDVSTPEIPDNPATATAVTVNGIGIPGDSSVSLLEESYSGSVWKRVVILTPDTENKGLYIVSSVSDVVARFTLAENEIALAFSLAEDENKASVEAMIAYTDSFVAGVTRLQTADNTTFTVAEIRPVPDNALLIDYYNQALVDNQAILYCGKEKVNSYLSTQTPAGFIVLLAPDESKNTFKVVETLNESVGFTNTVDPENMIIMVFHWRKTGTNYASAKERVELAKEQFTAGTKVEVFGFDFETLKRTPETNTPIYVAAVE